MTYLVDLVNVPEVAVTGFVEVDGLEDVAVEVDLRRELRLVVCAVEAHLEFREVLVVHFDVVHGLEALLGHFNACRLVDARQYRHGLLRVVEVLVVLAHVVAVVVRDRHVVGPLCAGEDGGFHARHCWFEKT